jgi:hypothetical protein
MGSKTIAVTSQRPSPITKKYIDAKTEPVPQKPFPNVRKSASTNDRIIEKRGRFGLDISFGIITASSATG